MAPTITQFDKTGARSRRRRRGSAILEAALVFLPTMAMMLAIIDFSVAIFIRSTLMNAVREGVRYGVTSRTTGAGGHDSSIKARVQAYSMGFLNGTAGANRIVIRYFDPVTGQYVTGVRSNRSGNILEVRVNNFPWIWIAPVWRSHQGLTFSVQSSDIMEAQPNGVPNR